MVRVQHGAPTLHGVRQNRSSKMVRTISDPTAQEMRDYLNSNYPECDEFEVEEAIYWFASNYHSGQWSNLYSALSTSEFRPSILANGPQQDYAYIALKDYYVESY